MTLMIMIFTDLILSGICLSSDFLTVADLIDVTIWNSTKLNVKHLYSFKTK